MSIDPTTYIHPTAIIDNGANIGANCKVWHWSHVCSGAKIDNNTSIGQNVSIIETNPISK